MEDYLSDLNQEQYEAAVHIDGPVLIIAGAGTGKTKTLVSRVSHILHQGVGGSNILLLTFTNKAAKEMQERICRFVGEAAGSSVMASTFHSFCAKLLRYYADKVGLGQDFSIIDSSDAMEIMDGIRARMLQSLREEGMVIPDFPTKAKLLSLYSASVNSMKDLMWIIKEDEDAEPYAIECKSIIDEYNEEKFQKNRVDYDDLLKFTVQVLEENEYVRFALDNQYRYIMCDEYQDTNYIQDKILNLLSRDTCNLAVVGDDNQSIYRFRGAVIENILTFAKRHDGCVTIKLVENYRSSQEILNLSNAVMAHAMEGIPKVLHGQFHGDKPHISVFCSDKDIADYVSSVITDRHENEGVPYKDMAVIVRNSIQSAYVEAKLVRLGTPYEKFGGQKFFDKSVIRYLLSFVRILRDYQDDIAWSRILKLIVGIGGKTSQSILNHILEDGYSALVDKKYVHKKYGGDLSVLYQIIQFLQSRSVYEQLYYIANHYYEKMMLKYIHGSKMSDDNKEREMQNLSGDLESAQVLVDMAKPYKSAKSFLDDIVLDQTTVKGITDYVNITTIHSAKGLEYDTVFLLNPIQGIFPKDYFDCPEDREELRCLYVALTRAKHVLEICISNMVRVKGRMQPSELSRHLSYLDVLGCCKCSNLSMLVHD